MKKLYSLLLFLLCAIPLCAQEAMQIHRADGVTVQYPFVASDGGSFTADALSLAFAAGERSVQAAQIDSITFGEQQGVVQLAWSADGVKVFNPYGFDIDVETDADGNVTVTSAADFEVQYVLTGTGTGSFKLYSVKKQVVTLQDLTLTAPAGPALNIQSKKKTEIVLPEGSVCSLADAATYSVPEDEDAKGCIFSEGQIVITGEGSLTVKGLQKHAIASDDYLSIESGSVTVLSAASDGLHAKDYFLMSGGSLTVSGTAGDCVDADEGYIHITGGTLALTAATADTKALKCDSILTIDGGDFTLTLSANQVKGIKSKQLVTITGGTLTFKATGGVELVDNEPSYCTCIKSDADIVVSGGEISIAHTGTAGKGLSADGQLHITGGSIKGTFTGAGGTYTNSSNQSDTYNATALKSDGEMHIDGGTLSFTMTGTGGKGIASSGVLTFGASTEDEGAEISVTTSGAAISGSSSGTTNPWWGPGGGGPGGTGGWGPGSSSSSGGKSKAIRGAANVVINAGHFTIKTSTDGAEGIESKATLTINGGTLEIETYDDAINAATSLVINGGEIYCYASNNDGIDSNGTLTITGGLIVSSGTTSPEEGFDCDNNTFKITGGTFIGMGGSTSSPTASQCTQVACKYSSATGTNNLVYNVVRQSDGAHIMSFTILRSYGSCTLLFSSPDIEKSTTYTVTTGGTVTGGTTFHGLTTGGTVSGGTTKKTFTPSSYSCSL